jgi:pimeloyl-ACP methyl ester carboxylesterase
MTVKIEGREATIAGHPVHYLNAGGGPPLILLHGGASDCTDWIPAMEALGADFTIYAPDLPGFGRSHRNGEGYYLEDFVTFLEEFILAHGLERVILGGHSFGGRICLGLVLRRPDLAERLVLVDSAGFGKTSLTGVVLLTFFNRLRSVLGKRQLSPNFLVDEGDDPHWACVADLPVIKTPALIIWSRWDPYLSIRNARKAAELLPDARLEVMPGYGHAPHRRYAETFYRLLKEFAGRNAVPNPEG